MMRDYLPTCPFEMLNMLTVWSGDKSKLLPSRRLWMAKSLLVLVLLHPSFHRNMAIVFH
jgi:hypothetical protein